MTSATWIWPMPSLDDRQPEISDGFGSRRYDANGTTRPHLGVDLMFRRRSRLDLADTYRPGSPNGTRWYFMPDDVPALAGASGHVRFARRTSTGLSVVIVHAEDWATYYTHLASLAVREGSDVLAGQPIGIVGSNPQDQRHPLKHLHFELWRHGEQRGVVNPKPYLDAWQRRVIAGSLPGLRNASLTYRPVGGPGERYPAWVRALDGRSGVYVIRQRDESGEPIVVYVGESHTNHLLGTLTRHFQQWRRWKSWWKDHFTEGHDPGLTYDRASVEVAVRVLTPDQAVDEEARLIRRLRPRDNLMGQPDLEEAPF